MKGKFIGRKEIIGGALLGLAGGVVAGNFESKAQVSDSDRIALATADQNTRAVKADLELPAKRFTDSRGVAAVERQAVDSSARPEKEIKGFSPVRLSETTAGKNYLEMIAKSKGDSAVESAIKEIDEMGDYTTRFMCRNGFDYRSRKARKDANGNPIPFTKEDYERSKEALLADVGRKMELPAFEEAYEALKEMQARGELKYDIEFYLGYIYGESNFDHEDISNKDAIGLMQLKMSREKMRLMLQTERGLTAEEVAAMPSAALKAAVREEILKIKTNLKYGIPEIETRIEHMGGNVLNGLWAVNIGESGFKKAVGEDSESIQSADSVELFKRILGGNMYRTSAWYSFKQAMFEGLIREELKKRDLNKDRWASGG